MINHQYWLVTVAMYLSQPSLFPNPRKTTKTKHWNQYIFFVKLCLSFNSQSKVYKRNIQMPFDQQPPITNFLKDSMPWIEYKSLSNAKELTSHPDPHPPPNQNKTEWSIAWAGKIELEHKGHLLLNVFHRRSSSIESCLPWKVILHRRLT